MKRNQITVEEDRLSKILFNKPENFVKKLKKDEPLLDSEELKPAWIDEADEIFLSNKVTSTSSKQSYAALLTEKYVKLVGTPNWARLDKKPKCDSEDEDTVATTVGHLQKNKTQDLQKDFLQIKRCQKINSTTTNEGPIIKCLEFHPTSSVAIVGGQSGAISLFSIGSKSNKLHSYQLPKFRVIGGRFTPDGAGAILCSDINHKYCVYDLIKSEPKLISFPRVITKPTSFELSPDGKYLAVVDGFDLVYIIYLASNELIRTLKHNSKVESFQFSYDNKLYTYCSNGEVMIWDLSTYRTVHKFIDEGCIKGSCIALSPCGHLLATGSGEGIVNIYECSNLTNSPTPVHTIQNLRTKITALKFNVSSEILGLSSSYYPNAIKLVHVPSYHVFFNFPDQQSTLHQVQTFNFTPNSGYLGLCNNKNGAFLYRLKHYKNY